MTQVTTNVRTTHVHLDVCVYIRAYFACAPGEKLSVFVIEDTWAARQHPLEVLQDTIHRLRRPSGHECQQGCLRALVHLSQTQRRTDRHRSIGVCTIFSTPKSLPFFNIRMKLTAYYLLCKDPVKISQEPFKVELVNCSPRPSEDSDIPRLNESRSTAGNLYAGTSRAGVVKPQILAS